MFSSAARAWFVLLDALFNDSFCSAFVATLSAIVVTCSLLAFLILSAAFLSSSEALFVHSVFPSSLVVAMVRGLLPSAVSYFIISVVYYGGLTGLGPVTLVAVYIVSFPDFTGLVPLVTGSAIIIWFLFI